MYLRLSCVAFALASQSVAFGSILPPNNLHLKDNLFSLANMTQAEFDAIVNGVVAQYKPLAKIHGAELVSNNLWTNPTVNASAEQEGKTWIINMYGGLARRPEVTSDGFTMVVCHELGHHFGGFPFYGNEDWGASEGQSDFFATQTCVRKIWRDDKDLNATFANAVTPQEKQKCDYSYQNVDDRNLCYRTVAAGQSLATLLSALNKEGIPKTDTPDTRIVTQTMTSHPAAQCRLDTYLAGALCTQSFDEKVIPGRNISAGQASLKAEEVASNSSCMEATGWVIGNRPKCWYGPKLEFQAMKYSALSVSETKGNKNEVVEPGESVALNFTLANATQRATENVQGTLKSSSKGVTIVKSQAQWPVLNPSQAHAALEPFLLQLDSNVNCGSKVQVELVATSTQGGTSLLKSFLVGKLIKSALGENTTRIGIPDNNKVGIKSEINNPTDESATSAQVNLAISHPFASDLKVTLVTPSGQIAKIYPEERSQAVAFAKSTKSIALAANDEDSKGIYKKFDVKLAAGSTQGIWMLKVLDGASRDIGYLEKWGLTLSKTVCEK